MTVLITGLVAILVAGVAAATGIGAGATTGTWGTSTGLAGVVLSPLRGACFIVMRSVGDEKVKPLAAKYNQPFASRTTVVVVC